MTKAGTEWPPLFFRQVCILSGILGILALRHPLPALAGLFLLPVLDARSRRPAACLVLALAFLAGYASARLAEPEKNPALPLWADEALTPASDAQSPFNTGLAVSARVRESSLLSDGRLRLLLEDVCPVSPGDAAPLPASLALTWQSPAIAMPGPGQTFHGVLRLRRIHAMYNPGVWETETYWRDQGVLFRAWVKGDGSRGDGPGVRIEGEASRSWNVRQALKSRVLALLAGTGKTAEAAFPSLSPPLSPVLSQGRAVLPALLFGDRSGLGRDSLDLVAKATLAHSLALSGMHLAFAAGLGYSLAAALGFIFPGLFLRLPRRKLGLLLALPPALCYLWLGAAPPSLLRAALMLLFWAWLAWRGKPRALMDGLIWALLLILLVDSLALYDIRLQLSALAVATMALVIPLLDVWKKRLAASEIFLSGPLRYILPFLVFSLAIQVALLPLTITAFNVTGALFFLNFLWLPVLGCVVMPLAFAGLACAALSLFFDAALWPQAADLCFNLASLPCELLLTGLSWLDGKGMLIAPVALRPHWPASFGFWLLLCCLPWFLARPSPHECPRPSRLPLLLAGCALVLMLLPEGLRFTEENRNMVRLRLLDVGQGQAVLVEWRGGGRALIDGGGFAGDFDLGKAVIVPALTDNLPPRIDWIINSHPDTDHLGGLLYPLETMRVGHFGDNGLPPHSAALSERRDAALAAKAVPASALAAGDQLTLGDGLLLEVLHPPLPGGETKPLSGNNAALVLRLVWKGEPLALICGDVEKAGLRRLRESGADLRAPLLILPHHGSASSLDPDFYRLVAPRAALVSCGYANQWHFPDQRVAVTLRDAGISLFTTAEKGQITASWLPGRRFTLSHARR